MYRFAIVAFGVSSSPFLLNAAIRHHLTSADIPREFAERIRKSLYVDDFVSGDDSDNSVLEMYENLKSSFKNGGFNMRKWVSNSKVLQERIEQSESPSHQVSSRFVKERPIQEEDETYSSSLFETAKNSTTSKLKVLGVGWDREKDFLLLDLTSALETDNTCLVTKRAILGTTSKLYDSLGLLSPVIILLKIIFQSICKTGVGWDDPVDSLIYEQWLKLVQDAKKVGVVQLKRHYFHGWSTADLQSVQLHGFGDASEKAYGAVVYLRVETATGTSCLHPACVIKNQSCPDEWRNHTSTGVSRRSHSGPISQHGVDSI